MISIYTLSSLLIYTGWKLLNIHQRFQYEKSLSLSNCWDILFSMLMCYWLIVPSVLFLIAKLFNGIFALGLGLYISILPLADTHLKHKDKVIDNYWSYAITDLAVCIVCFFIAVLGVSNV